MQIFIILALLIAIAAVTFALQNPGTITIKFLLWQFSGSMALVLLVIFAMGFVSSLLLSWVSLIRRKMKDNNRSQPDANRPPPPY